MNLHSTLPRAHFLTNAHLASSAVSQKHANYKKGLVINAIDLTDDAKELFKTDLEGRVGVNEDATEKKFKIETPELQDSTASDQGAPPPAPPQPPAQQPNANAPPPGQPVGSGLIIFRSCPRADGGRRQHHKRHQRPAKTARRYGGGRSQRRGRAARGATPPPHPLPL